MKLREAGLGLSLLLQLVDGLFGMAIDSAAKKPAEQPPAQIEAAGQPTKAAPVGPTPDARGPAGAP
jgi:hypothetical protein